jgi:hypothetical protein
MSLTILRNLPEPERVIAKSGNGGSYASSNAPVLPVDPCRHMELLSEREVDRFIRSVKRRREDMRSAIRAAGYSPSTHQLVKRRDGRGSVIMPIMAGGAGPSAGQQGVASRQGVASQPATMAEAALPFDQAAKRGIEPGPSYAWKPEAGSVNLGVAPLPAQGYLRAVELNLQTTEEGETAEGELGLDYPWGLFETVRFQDTNGNQLDDLPGFVLFADNVFGGYAGAPDPRVDLDYLKTIGKTSFQVMLVRELAPNGFGSIANLSASQAYKLTLKMGPNTAGQTWKHVSKKAPVFLVSVYMHFWQLPEPVSLDGRPQVQTPPFHGTTQYRWFAPANSVTQNVNTKIEQVGNEIRQIIIIGREANGIRTNKVFPEPFQLRWDTEFLLITGIRQLRKIQRELVNDYGQGLTTAELVAADAGIITLPFNFGEGRNVGGSGVNSWLPTVTGTRLQITGTQPASEPGELGIYVNDVSVAETNPALRPVAHGPGGYTPQVAPRLQGAA